LTLASLAPGVHVVTAAYSGDANYQATGATPGSTANSVAVTAYPAGQNFPRFSVTMSVVDVNGVPVTHSNNFDWNLRSYTGVLPGDQPATTVFSTTEVQAAINRAAGRPLYYFPVTVQQDGQSDLTYGTRIRLQISGDVVCDESQVYAGRDVHIAVWQEADGSWHGGFIQDYAARILPPLQNPVANTSGPLMFDRYEVDDSISYLEMVCQRYAGIGVRGLLLTDSLDRPPPGCGVVMARYGMSLVGDPDGHDPTNLPAPADQAAAAARYNAYYAAAGINPRVFVVDDEPQYVLSDTIPLYRDLTNQDPSLVAARLAWKQYAAAAGLDPNRWPILRSEVKNQTDTEYWVTTVRFLSYYFTKQYADWITTLKSEPTLKNAVFIVDWNKFRWRIVDSSTAVDGGVGGSDLEEYANMVPGACLWTETWGSDQLNLYENEPYLEHRLQAAASRTGNTWGLYIIAAETGAGGNVSGVNNGLYQQITRAYQAGASVVGLYQSGPPWYSLPSGHNTYAQLPAANLQEIYSEVRNANAGYAVATSAAQSPPVTAVWTDEYYAAPLDPAGVNATDKGLSHYENAYDWEVELGAWCDALNLAGIPWVSLGRFDTIPASVSVLRISTPNLTQAWADRINAWAAQPGHTLVCAPGAGRYDEYGQPLARPLPSATHARVYIATTAAYHVGDTPAGPGFPGIAFAISGSVGSLAGKPLPDAWDQLALAAVVAPEMQLKK
jgi:hypothetical protein